MSDDINEYSRDKSKSNKDNSSKIDFECPHCSYNNSIKFSKKIECKNCNKSMMGASKAYKTSKIDLIITALASATIASVAADGYASADEMIIIATTGIGTMIYMSRLSIETEYKIMKTCIGEFGTNIKTRDTCFCVVKKLNNYLNPILAKAKGEEWLFKQLEMQYKECEEHESLSNQTKK